MKPRKPIAATLATLMCAGITTGVAQTAQAYQPDLSDFCYDVPTITHVDLKMNNGETKTFPFTTHELNAYEANKQEYSSITGHGYDFDGTGICIVKVGGNFDSRQVSKASVYNQKKKITEVQAGKNLNYNEGTEEYLGTTERYPTAHVTSSTVTTGKQRWKAKIELDPHYSGTPISIKARLGKEQDTLVPVSRLQVSNAGEIRRSTPLEYGRFCWWFKKLEGDYKSLELTTDKGEALHPVYTHLDTPSYQWGGLSYPTNSRGKSAAATAIDVNVTVNGRKQLVRLFALFAPFSDTGPGSPFYDETRWMYDNGISTGYPNGTFGYGQTVLRQDMAAFLRREAKLRGVGDAAAWKPSDADWARFKDINRSTPHAEDILWLAHSGITTGFADGTFKGGWTVNRQDMAAFLQRLAKLSGEQIPVQPMQFRDVNDSTPHADAIRWLGGTGISTGFVNKDGSRSFNGGSNVVRQDMAAFIYRLDQRLA